MIIQINNNGNPIAKCHLLKNEWNNLMLLESKNCKVFDESHYQQTNNGIEDKVEIDIETEVYNRAFDEIIEIMSEIGRQNGRWEENAEILEDIVTESFDYIVDKCREHHFTYTIKGKVLAKACREHYESTISVTDIEERKITYENYHQFKALTQDIAEQLIDFLKNQLIWNKQLAIWDLE